VKIILRKWIKERSQKKSLYRSFILSEEYSLKKPFSVIDLKSDPFEENEILPTRDLDTLMEYVKFLPTLFDLEIPKIMEDQTSQTQNKKSTSQDEEEEVKKELRKLGYIWGTYWTSF